MFQSLGTITVRVDRVYGNVTVYPVCERAQLLAKLAGMKTLTGSTLATIKALGFEVEQVPGALEVVAAGSFFPAALGARSRIAGL